jgi:hypothetical protein
MKKMDTSTMCISKHRCLKLRPHRALRTELCVASHIVNERRYFSVHIANIAYVALRVAAALRSRVSPLRADDHPSGGPQRSHKGNASSPIWQLSLTYLTLQVPIPTYLIRTGFLLWSGMLNDFHRIYKTDLHHTSRIAFLRNASHLLEQVHCWN